MKRHEINPEITRVTQARKIYIGCQGLQNKYQNLQCLVTITSMSVQVVYKNQITSGQTIIKQQLNLGNLLNGAYVITAHFSNMEIQRLKVLKL